MRATIILLCLFGSYNVLHGQKPTLDFEAMRNWTFVSGSKLSDDGNYAAYTINGIPSGSSTLVIRSIKDDREIKILGVTSYEAAFCNSSKVLLVIKHDSLHFVQLKDFGIKYAYQIKNFQVGDRTNWIGYMNRSVDNLLTLQDLETGRQTIYHNVQEYFLLHNKAVIKVASSGVEKVVIVDLQTGKEKKAAENVSIKNVVIYETGEKIAFIVTSKEAKKTLQVWDSHKELCLQLYVNDDRKWHLENIEGFSRDGKRLLFRLKPVSKLLSEPSQVNVNVWSYLDERLQSAQIKSPQKNNYLCVAEITDNANGNFLQLENAFERVWDVKNGSKYFILVSRRGAAGEWNWNSASKSRIYLLSAITGEKIEINPGIKIPSLSQYHIDPFEKFVVYYDASHNSYFSYEIATRKYRDLAKGTKAKWTVANDEPTSKYLNIGIAAFALDGNAVVVYDQNDLYLLDLHGEAPAINITNGYGSKNNIVFRLALDGGNQLLSRNEPVILNAFSKLKKDNGFFSIQINKRGDPTLLTMQPKMLMGLSESEFLIECPSKARNTNAYLVRHMDATESPNYFYTTNFKNFLQISYNYPERNYNWLTTELVSYKTRDGRLCQGLLYKPENFNSNIKYPVLFNYYERRSDGLHGYLTPDFSEDNINIPYYVSNGYLVFTPDIHYTIGYPGKSALNSIEGAAEYLSQFEWIDSKKMGIQGHSFGGFETSYVITQTNRFAAACAGAPMTNFMSSYGSIPSRWGESRQPQYELYRDRIGTDLWTGKNLYEENSPVLYADRIKTPLLIIHNDGDDDVPWQQGIELFTGLRRLGKKVWMLQYVGEGHSVGQQINQFDYTIRMKQFFDHYLKDEPPPRWMTRGIPASMKGIDDGLELDTEIKTPGSGLAIENKTKN